MTKSIILNNSLVTIFGNFGGLNSFIISIANVRQIIRGLHVVTIFDMKGKKYCFECGATTRFIVDGVEHQALNNAYYELEKEMKNL